MVAMLRQCPECGAGAGEPHLQPCSFHQRYEAARGPLFEWLAGLPEEYERLKAARESMPSRTAQSARRRDTESTPCGSRRGRRTAVLPLESRRPCDALHMTNATRGNAAERATSRGHVPARPMVGGVRGSGRPAAVPASLQLELAWSSRSRRMCFSSVYTKRSRGLGHAALYQSLKRLSGAPVAGCHRAVTVYLVTIARRRACR
jgi:hypothetical protein